MRSAYGHWIPESEREQAEPTVDTVVDAVSVLATHLTEVIKSHAAEILGRQGRRRTSSDLKKTNKALVEEVVPDLLTVGEVQKVLQNSSPNAFPSVAIWRRRGAHHIRATKDTEILTEYVRHAMARQITQANVQNGQLPCDARPGVENQIAGGVQRTDRGS